jgi:hypothetical protein
MYEEYVSRYLVDKNFDEFENDIKGMDKKSVLSYIEQEIQRIKNEIENERNSLEYLSYDEITNLHDRMMGIEYNYTSLINLRQQLQEKLNS